MKWFEETTQWTGTKQPNHVYLMDDSKSKMYAYIKFGKGDPESFKNPIRIFTQGRTFKEQRNFTMLFEKFADPAARTWAILGSKGNNYTVVQTHSGYSCSCSGFKFRGACKHVESVK
jgi:hypothetical protein